MFLTVSYRHKFEIETCCKCALRVLNIQYYIKCLSRQDIRVYFAYLQFTNADLNYVGICELRLDSLIPNWIYIILKKGKYPEIGAVFWFFDLKNVNPKTFQIYIFMIRSKKNIVRICKICSCACLMSSLRQSGIHFQL